METVSKLLKEHGLFVLGGAFVGAIGGYFLSPKKAELSSDTKKALKILPYVLENAQEGDVESVLKTIDNFGWNVEFMMNVGDVKGKILDDAVKSAKPKVVLELGTFVGYSACRTARLLPEGSIMYCAEINPIFAAIAAKIIDYAGMSSKVKIVNGPASAVINLLKPKYKVDHVDLVFIDHTKNLYLPDLKILEASGLLVDGTVLVADNIVYPGAPEYAHYVRNSPHYSTKYYKTTLEYHKDREDGVEVSTYIKNPTPPSS